MDVCSCVVLAARFLRNRGFAGWLLGLVSVNSAVCYEGAG